MQKALQQMNLLLPQVVADITGETGMAIVRAIVAGERDSVKLAQFRDGRCRSSEATIAKALTGTWKEEHVFALTQAVAFYDFSTEQVAACDAQIERHYGAMKPRWEPTASDTPWPSPAQRRKKRKLELGPSSGEADLPDLRLILGLGGARRPRRLRLFRLGWLWLLVQLIQGQPMPLPRRLVPEPWPDIPERLEPSVQHRKALCYAYM
jgi:hypothetical protein